MGTNLSLNMISLLIVLAYIAVADAATFDITKYGAKADGNSDISQALLSAWKEACAATSPSTVVIPGGSYLLKNVTMEGPCKAAIEVQVRGTLKAPADLGPKVEGWVVFQIIDRLTLSGGGTFDGQGGSSWTKNDCVKNAHCNQLPTSLRLNFLNNSIIRDITSKDSKEFHINLLGCKNLTMQHLTITAPGDSPNTDGIHMGRSSGISITDVRIQTGDDCISIGDGCQQIKIEKVTCGPGHGLSVGSLGKYQNEQDVVGIMVKNCTLSNTTNGVRVKTWPDSPAGAASDMHFEDIIMDNVQNPVLIDQEYCPNNQCKLGNPSRVKLSKVSFKNIRGTTSTQLAVKLDCSKALPCQEVEIGDIDLKYTGPAGPASSQCTNVQPTLSGKQNPATCSGSARSS